MGKHHRKYYRKKNKENLYELSIYQTKEKIEPNQDASSDKCSSVTKKWSIDGSVENQIVNTLDCFEQLFKRLWKMAPELSMENAERVANFMYNNFSLKRTEKMAAHAFESVPDYVENMKKYIQDHLPHISLERAEEIAYMALTTMQMRASQSAKRMANRACNLMHHRSLPKWMRDNEHLVAGHRPPLNSYAECFRSIFRLHTETGNIWTHLLGCLVFVMLAIFLHINPSENIDWYERFVLTTYFTSAILCLGFSCLYHTVYCHSENVGKFFSKLDYCGIALLIMGSFVPWLYHSFYCRYVAKVTYFFIVFLLGFSTIVVSMWDQFSQPKYRTLRAAVFAGLAMSGLLPICHHIIENGFEKAVDTAALDWIAIVGTVYLFGAVIYATRTPERFWPGKFDIWFQSHQIFHVCVFIGAFCHYQAMLHFAISGQDDCQQFSTSN